MKVRRLHRWNVTYHDAVAIQNRLREHLILKAPSGLATRARLLVAGADISYSKSTNQLFAAVLVICLARPGSQDEPRVIETRTASGQATFPYIPGLLSFREIPILARVFSALRTTPDVVMVDGQGTSHPRGFGLACHLGILLDCPSIGCAKRLLCGEHSCVPRHWGEHVPLLFDGRKVGAALRTQTDIAPVYVSPGHRMDLQTAIAITRRCRGRYRVPEPTRRAHLVVTQMRTRHLG